MAGKRVRGALYIHISAIGDLPDSAQVLVQRAEAAAGAVEWNVARIEATTVGLLLYRDFERDPFPELSAAVRVDLSENRITSRDFRWSKNPLILHRKELLVSCGHPEAHRWRALSDELEKLGLFKNPHLIGRRQAWSARLESVGLTIGGCPLCLR